jgi:hypothetical protein
VDFASGEMDLAHPQIVSWIETAAKAVSLYYGKFPVASARVLVQPIAGERGVLTGTTWGDVDASPAFTRMRLGQHTTVQDLTDDWTMTHELTHMAFPSLAEEHHWLEEGLATYVEPVARAQAGDLTPAKIWEDMVEGMPKGQPQSSSHGLDHSHSWGSTYWGGALFCLMADVAIRKQTEDRKGLQDALRSIVVAGGTIDHDWPVSKALTVGDQATGTNVLTDLYQKMGQSAYAPVDLDSLWAQLGVRSHDRAAILNDHAPLAQIRRSITVRRPLAAGTAK